MIGKYEKKYSLAILKRVRLSLFYKLIKKACFKKFISQKKVSLGLLFRNAALIFIYRHVLNKVT